MVDLHALVWADHGEGAQEPVLDWRFIGLMA